MTGRLDWVVPLRLGGERERGNGRGEVMRCDAMRWDTMRLGGRRPTPTDDVSGCEAMRCDGWMDGWMDAALEVLLVPRSSSDPISVLTRLQVRLLLGARRGSNTHGRRAHVMARAVCTLGLW